jgi:hypothetical protein
VSFGRVNDDTNKTGGGSDSGSSVWRRVFANASSLSWHYCPTHMPIVIDIPIAALQH